ncbi:transcriptional regulation of mitochondrial recombination-domain-containing protein [Podospora appendiculata]|uniref:Large ribosomal subunit protein mL67 n=1 Tax=Podospora appendiculata TaxID=314037 RepID=A0AAE0XFY8_9PEZI|nr:transcriptional regulation of mitochondrial recombination-domain-containing protein [Podospora appendiculata]
MNALHALSPSSPACRRLAFRALGLGLSRSIATTAARPAKKSRSAGAAAAAVAAKELQTKNDRPGPLPKQPPHPPRPDLPGGHPADHGEFIWVYTHIESGHIVYSHKSVMRPTKAQEQLPYTGKKLVPAHLRKDYWRPMAAIQFPPGLGVVGRSVHQKLRELKHRHELEWADSEDTERAAELYNMTKRERGEALNDQKANCIADMAAVLQGQTRGNLVTYKAGTYWYPEELEKIGNEKRERKRAAKEAAAAAKVAAKAAAAAGEAPAADVPAAAPEKVVEPPAAKDEQAVEEKTKLHLAKIFWADANDSRYAQSWSKNVTHFPGLPAKDTQWQNPMLQQRPNKLEGNWYLKKKAKEAQAELLKHEVTIEAPRPVEA